MAQWEFWTLFGLIVIGIFQMVRSLDEAANSIRGKMDEMLSEIHKIELKLDRQ